MKSCERVRCDFGQKSIGQKHVVKNPLEVILAVSKRQQSQDVTKLGFRG